MRSAAKEEISRELISRQLEPFIEKVSRKGTDNTAIACLTGFTALCKTAGETPDQIIAGLKEGKRDAYRFLDDSVKLQTRERGVRPDRVRPAGALRDHRPFDNASSLQDD